MNRYALILCSALLQVVSTVSLAGAAPCESHTDCGQSASGHYGCNYGSYLGVIAYNNGGWTGSGCGEYQCVEFVRRFYENEVDNDLGTLSPGYAVEAFSDWADPYQGNLTQFVNGVSTVPPAPGDIYCQSGNTYGHIAIIKSVDLTSNPMKVVIIDQNRSASSSTLERVLYKDGQGRYRIQDLDGVYQSDSWETQGWLRDPNYSAGNYSCALVDQFINGVVASDATVEAGEVLNLTVVYRNTGSASWSNSSVKLWSCDGGGSAAASWFDPVGWVGCPSSCSDIQVTGANESSVDHNETATYAFQAKVPDSATDQDVRVWFRLYVGSTAMDGWPGQNFYIHVRNEPGGGSRIITGCLQPPHTQCIGPAQ